MEEIKITENTSKKEQVKLYLYDVSSRLTDGEQLKALREKCLNTTHPLRFIQLSTNEKWWMNERNYWRSLNCH